MINSGNKSNSQNTISDVAKAAGVSISTVSRVINQSAPVSPELEAKVKSAINQLDYRPQIAARTLAGRKTKTIGLVLAEIGTDFYPLVIAGVEEEAHRNKYSLLISVTTERSIPDPEEVIPFNLGDHYTDGLLVFPASLSDDELRRKHAKKFPIILIQRTPPPGLQIPHIKIENKNSARKLVDHLIEVHGYKRIAFLAGIAEHEDAKLREQGYLESLAAHNIPFDPRLKTRGNFQKKDSQEAVKHWLDEGLDFDAIFACDDISAIGALSALNQAGLRVPEDIAVVGFDDVEIARYLSPPLTTVAVPIEELGRIAMQQLLSLIQTGSADPVIEISTELVIRRSCGCHPA